MSRRTHFVVPLVLVLALLPAKGHAQPGPDPEAKERQDLERERLERERSFLDACRIGSEDVVALMLSTHKVSADANDELGNPAIIIASRFAHEKIVARLLDAGADPNAKDSDGQTALMRAAESGHVHLVELLVSRKASVDEVDLRGKTALSYARQGAQKSAIVVKILEEHSKDRGWKDERGQSVPILIGFGLVGGLLLSILEHAEGARRNRPRHRTWFLWLFAWLIIPTVGALLIVAFVLTGAIVTPVLAMGIGLSGPALVRAWRMKPLTVSPGELTLPQSPEP